MAGSVLVVDDDRDFVDECVAALQPRRVVGVTDAKRALAVAEKESPDLALVDLWLDDPESSRPVWGIDVIRDLRARFASLPIVLVTAGHSGAYARAAIDAGADGALPKFLGPAKILAIIESDLLHAAEPAAPMSLARNEYEYMTKVYIDHARNVVRSARALGIPRSTLYRKLRSPAPRR